MRMYEVFNQTTDLFGQTYFEKVGHVNADVPSYAVEGGAERAGAEAIKVFSGCIGNVFAVKSGRGFAILQRPLQTPERVTI